MGALAGVGVCGGWMVGKRSKGRKGGERGGKGRKGEERGGKGRVGVGGIADCIERWGNYGCVWMGSEVVRYG